jgi:hypothetical protein
MLIIAGMVAACTGSSGQTPANSNPVPDMARGPVYLDKVDLQLRESMPVELGLHLVGNLPTPCHQLAWQSEIPEGGGKIAVEVYSKAPIDQECIQVLSPLDETINLGRVHSGHYVVFVNGERIGEFDA